MNSSKLYNINISLRLLVNIFYYISYMDYHFNVCFQKPINQGLPLILLRANRRILDCVRLMLWISYRNFSYHHAIRFGPAERIATRFLPQSNVARIVNFISPAVNW